MGIDTWQSGTGGDWNTAADWSGGVPSASTAAAISGAGSFVVTLMGDGSAASLSVNAAGAEFYLAGALTLTGTFALQAGTFALAGGVLDGGVLAMQGGGFLSTGGTFSAVQVDGALQLTQADESLCVNSGLALAGASGTGVGSLAVSGAYASVDFIGSQSLRTMQVTLGAAGSAAGGAGPASLQITHAATASAGATLSLGSSVSVRDNAGQAQLVVGSLSPGLGAVLPDMLVNSGLIAASSAAATLTIDGNGTLVNQGTISVANGATLDLATQGIANTGVISVNDATLALGGVFAGTLLSSLGSVALAGGTVSIAGTANLNGGTLSLGAGSAITGSLGALMLSGTMADGTVLDAGGGLNFSAGSGTLSGVTYQGNLSLGAGCGVTLANGAAVTGGSIAVTGAGASLLLQGAETLNDISIALGAAGAGAAIGTADGFLASGATTATLGPQTSVTLAGANGELGANGFSPFPGLGLNDTLDNQGTLTAAVAGGTLAISGFGTFLNQGGIEVSGGATLLDTALTFANAGVLTVGQGGTAILGAATGIYGATPAWSNSGQVAANGGTLVLEGAYSTAQLGSLSESGGVIELDGTLANTGATLTLGASVGLSSVLLLGTVTGGVIADQSASLAVGATGAAMLQGVTYDGTLAVDSAGATLGVMGGFSVSGQVKDQGAGALLDFIGSQSLGSGQVLLGAAGQAASIDVGHNYAVSGGSTLTFGAGVGITQSGMLAGIGTGAQLAGDGIVNRGSISADTSGGTLAIGGQSFANKGTISVGNGDTLALEAASFSNTGLISAAGATLAIADSVTLAALGQLSLNDATVDVSGTLNLGGGTISLGTASQIGQLSLTGTLSAGIVSESGGGLLASGGADLSGIVYQGVLDLSRPFTDLGFSQGLTVLPAVGPGAGTILITGAESRLIATGTESLENVTVTIGAGSQTYEGEVLPSPELAAGANATLTLGPGAVVNAVGATGQLGDSALGRWTDAIVNEGQVINASNGDGFSLSATDFYNQGTLTATGGGVIWVNDSFLKNTGTFAIGAGSVVQVALFDYFASPASQSTVLCNAGTIAMGGGILHEMNANGLFPGVPLLNQGGGQITGNGTVIAPVSNAGTIEAAGGELTMAGTLSGTGSLLIGQGATLNLANAVGPGQMASFLSNAGTLALSDPASFDGLISNFGGGNMIDLPGQPLTFVAISNGTLAVNTPTEQFFIGSSSALGGALMAGHDGHGGTTIAYVPRNGTPGPTTLAVDQPGMLFWTTPSGDILRGSAANLNGAEACNWSPYSSLDLTDLNPSVASLSVSDTGGLTVASFNDGTHSCSVTFNAPIGAGAFHLSSDGHGGTVVNT